MLPLTAKLSWAAADMVRAHNQGECPRSRMSGLTHNHAPPLRPYAVPRARQSIHSWARAAPHHSGQGRGRERSGTARGRRTISCLRQSRAAASGNQPGQQHQPRVEPYLRSSIDSCEPGDANVDKRHFALTFVCLCGYNGRARTARDAVRRRGLCPDIKPRWWMTLSMTRWEKTSQDTDDGATQEAADRSRADCRRSARHPAGDR